ncbi:MAG: hypothetical protein RLZZ01_1748 [Actinomycetota bacterium]
MSSTSPSLVRVAPRVLGATAVTLAGGSLVMGGQPAQALSFTVTNTSDGGGGSLRYAIMNANDTAGVDTITITATGTLELYTNLVITESVTIVGPGVDDFAIDGWEYDVCDVIEVSTADVDLALSGLTITGADCDAIDMESTGGSLSLTDVAIIDTYNNGVEVDGVSTLTITNSFFRHNGEGEEWGSGVKATDVGVVTVTGSTFHQNYYSGLYVDGATSVTVSTSAFTYNGHNYDGFEYGTGIKLVGVSTVSLTEVTVKNTYDDGIDIYGADSVTMTDLTVRYNDDEGIEFDSDTRATSVTITNSTVKNNDDNGIDLDSIVTLTISNVSANYNDDGLNVGYTDSATLTKITASNNSEDGLDLFDVQDVNVTEVTARYNGSDGFEFDFYDDWSDSISITDSTFSYNSDTGINGDDVVALTLSGVTAAYNSSYGLYVQGLDSATITDSTFSGNVEEGVKLMEVEESVTITDVTVENNGGYGVYVYGTSGNTTTDVTISGLSANSNSESGLFITDVASVSVVESSFDANDNEGLEIYSVSGDVTIRDVDTTDSSGGSLYIGGVQGTVLVESSTFVAGGSDVYISNAEGDVTLRDVTIADGGSNGLRLYNLSGETVLERVTISNSYDDGIDVEVVASLTLLNSTITGSGDDGIDVDAASGYALLAEVAPAVPAEPIGIGSSVILSHSTITGNTEYGVVVDGATYVETNCVYVPGYGNQCDYERLEAASSITIDHSIVSGNGYADVYNASEGNESEFQGSTTVSWSLVDEGSAHGGSTNVEADDPMLGELADNGGETLTMLPLSGSPAISAGNPDVTGQPETDQRGVARVRNRIEIGAVEVDADQGVLEVQAPPAAGEAEGIPVTVLRTGGSDGPASMTLRACDGTERTVSWADGETGPKTVTFPLTNNTADDPDRNCAIEIVSSTNADAGLVASFPVVVTDLEDTVVPTLPPTGGPAGLFAALAAAVFGAGAVMARFGRRRSV